MTTLTELLAAVVVHSSAVALSHFGMAIEPAQEKAPPPAERVIARTHAAAPQPKVVKTACPLPAPKAHAIHA